MILSSFIPIFELGILKELDLTRQNLQDMAWNYQSQSVALDEEFPIYELMIWNKKLFARFVLDEKSSRKKLTMLLREKALRVVVAMNNGIATLEGLQTVDRLGYPQCSEQNETIAYVVEPKLLRWFDSLLLWISPSKKYLFTSDHSPLIHSLKKLHINNQQLIHEFELYRAIIQLTQENNIQLSSHLALFEKAQNLIKQGLKPDQALESLSEIINHTHTKILSHRFARAIDEPKSFGNLSRPYEETPEFADKVEKYEQQGLSRADAYRLAKNI